MSLPIKLVCFDVNKTLIHENTWLDLNKAMGISAQEDAEWLNEYKQGRLSYMGWQSLLEKRYIASGRATKARILAVITRYSYLEGAREIVRYLQRQGYMVSLLSGAMDMLVETIARELGIQYYNATNRFLFDAQDYLLSIECQADDITTKATQFKTQCDHLGIDETQTVCVGDGDNDIELFRLSQHGVTFKGSPIEKEAWKVIERLSDIQTFL